MPLIDSNGLADGDRINSCSKMAQLYYPRMMAASNGYGRMRIDYLQIIASVFPRWRKEDLPSEPELLGYFQEYAHNRLIFLYSSAGQLWGQWDAKAGTFGKYQTVIDKRSPVPPEKEFTAWIKDNREHSNKESVAMAHFELVIPEEKLPEGNKKLRQDSGKISAKLPHGVGVGVGVGDGVACDVYGVKPSARKTRRPVSQAAQVSTSLAETKHHRIAGMVISAWDEHNLGATCPFGEADGKQLKLLLEKTSGWPDTNYAQCLVNMYATEGFPRSELPMHFLPRLPSYFSGPKDRYSRELSNVGTRTTSKANDREQRIVERALKYRTVAAGAIDSAGTGEMAVPGNGRSGVSGLEGEPEIIPPEKDSGGIGSHHAEPPKV